MKLDQRLIEANVAFTMAPADYQLSVHFHNLQQAYGRDQIAYALKGQAHSFILAAQIANLNDYFGSKAVRTFWGNIITAKYGKGA
jgi:hypothetical protein